jgi:hypothetical protein
MAATLTSPFTVARFEKRRDCGVLGCVVLPIPGNRRTFGGRKEVCDE